MRRYSSSSLDCRYIATRVGCSWDSSGYEGRCLFDVDDESDVNYFARLVEISDEADGFRVSNADY